jgi:malonyl-CoA decarboxylase
MLDRKVTQSGFLHDLLGAMAGRGRRLFDFLPAGPVSDENLEALCEALLSSRGEASGAALANGILDAYLARDGEGRGRFFVMLARRFGIDADSAVAAAEAYRAAPGAATMQRLQAEVEPRRQQLLRRLNLAPGGTAALVAMRADLLARLAGEPTLREVDADFLHLFQSWFNPGFLEVKRIDLNTPAAVLDKIIRYEAVHQISDWNDLRRRIDPGDRRLYAFFHPRLASEPLVFLEVALTIDTPTRINAILAADREILAPDRTRTAVFYSISNTQGGLRGVSFGGFLIKQVLDDLQRELPNLKNFVTLSPLPGFARWLADARAGDLIDTPTRAAVAAIDRSGWWLDPAAEKHLKPSLSRLAVLYLTTARNAAGAPLDPVARFHLGNGASLERVTWPGDLSAVGIAGGLGVMANYRYRVEDIEQNHEAFANAGRIAVSQSVAKLMPPRGAA